MLELNVQYLNSLVPRIKKIEVGDWIDLSIIDDVYLKAKEFKLLHLGVAMSLPKGYEAWIAPRSSTFLKYGIIQANSIGIIDSSYCGPNDWWMFPAYATRDIKIAKDTRICQFRIIKSQEDLKIIETEHLQHKNRGGFGSTGEV